MTDIKILGAPPSSYTRTARMIAIEKGLAFELVTVDFRGPSHLERHPWGKIPILQHGDFELIETAAIARYLDAIGSGPGLVPDDPRAAALMDKWISVVNCYAYDSLVRNYLFHYLFPRTADGKPDKALIQERFPSAEKDLREIEKGFAGEWLVGAGPSLADFFVAPILAYVARLPEAAAVLETCPRLRRLNAAMSERRSFKETVPPARGA